MVPLLENRMIDVNKLRDISDLLTTAANVPIKEAAQALHEARIDLFAVINAEDRFNQR